MQIYLTGDQLVTLQSLEQWNAEFPNNFFRSELSFEKRVGRHVERVLGKDDQTTLHALPPRTLQTCLSLSLAAAQQEVVDFSLTLDFIEKVVTFSSFPLLVSFCDFLIRILDPLHFPKIKKNLNWISKIINLALQKLGNHSHHELRGR